MMVVMMGERIVVDLSRFNISSGNNAPTVLLSGINHLQRILSLVFTQFFPHNSISISISICGVWFCGMLLSGINHLQRILSPFFPHNSIFGIWFGGMSLLASDSSILELKTHNFSITNIITIITNIITHTAPSPSSPG